jgi:hypothetical protein
MLGGKSALSAPSLNFARRMFRGAAIYGIVVLTPMYAIAAPSDRPDTYYGFIGCALVFQWLFWIIGGDPTRYRSLMPAAVAEKLVYAVPALALASQGKAPVIVIPFAIIDLLLGTGFLIARGKTPA